MIKLEKKLSSIDDRRQIDRVTARYLAHILTFDLGL